MLSADVQENLAELHLPSRDLGVLRVQPRLEDGWRVQGCLGSLVEAGLLVELQLGRRDLGDDDEILAGAC